MSREQEIRDIALALHREARGERPTLFAKRQWVGRVMKRVMREPAFKVQFYRFIDVLPALRDDRQVLGMLKEYFTEDALSSVLLREGMRLLPEKGPLPERAGRLVRKNVEGLARLFIGGRSPEDALSALEALRREGAAVSVDLLGEKVVSEEEVGEFQKRYLALMEFLHTQARTWPENPLLDRTDRGPIPRVDVSLKITSFYSQLDPLDWEGSIEAATAAIRPLFQRAVELPAAITFDVEDYQVKDLTLAVFRRVMEEFPGYAHGGVVIQCYLKEAREDLDALVRWARKRENPVTVRLVKGAYWDHEVVVNRRVGWPVPVFLKKADTDRMYEDLTRVLMKNAGHVRPAIASHNLRSVANAISLAASRGLPREALEFQMLYGLADPLRRAITRSGHRVRVYTPVGELIPGMAYIIRRLLENTANESFLRQAFFEEVAFEALVKPPGAEEGKNKEEEEKEEGIEEKSIREEEEKGPRGPFGNEPHTDFSREDSRKKMAYALGTVRKGLGKTVPLVIGGREVETGEVFASVNPARPDEVVARVARAGRAEAERAVQEARRAWEGWRRTPAEERAEHLRRAAEEMKKHRYELAALEVYEEAKAWREADADVAEAMDFLRYYAREMLRLSGPGPLGAYPGERNLYHYIPRGVGVVISPWNFPLAIPTGMTCGALVTGNCVILKPSSLSPAVASRLVEAFRGTGLPPGVLQFLPGPGREVGEHLVGHPGVDFVAFTGSRDVGLRILERAHQGKASSRSIKQVVAEMGGKNAIIVDETADLDEAVTGVAVSALGYQGQKCSACSRAIVVERVHDAFVRRLREAMKSVKIGPPEEPGNFMGPVVEKAALEKIRRYVELGKEEGRLALQKEVPEDRGYYIGPVLFTDVTPEARIAREEIFGPALAVLRARDMEDALRMANATDYALTGGMYSRSPANIRRAMEEFRAGNLYINRPITGALVGRQPFGGYGLSGVGSKAGGPDYLLQFMNPRSISENTLRRGFAPEEDIT
jgi:RHH-type proline utilization regulon transcriptional repressor/proline dehydrogenase/delta 1-pyrroline-5-carboxylate dehydrogenase